MKIFENINSIIGSTPLVRLKTIGNEFGAEVLAKLEFFNPLASVKDRIGIAMIEAAETQGKQIVVVLPDTGERYLSTDLIET